LAVLAALINGRKTCCKVPVADIITPAEAEQIAMEACIYGYSLITTEVTGMQMSNVPKREALRGPMNQFVNILRYPPGDYCGVSAPNADTLYPVPGWMLALNRWSLPIPHGQTLLPFPHV
jgi:hypothetical protein